MNTISPVVPPRAETQGTTSLTKLKNMIGVYLLLFYVIMVAVTIVTLKFNVSNPNTFNIPLNFT